jgi:type II secretory pathway component GspD/PulD (secretin)
MRKLRATTNFMALLLALAAATSLGQGAIEVISLRHRTAEQVIPILQPLLAPGGALTGQYNQLIVRTSPDNLAQIRSVLDTIDRPARRLMILVRFDSVQETAARAVQGDVRVSNRASSADLTLRDTRSALDERVDQRLQVLEGGQATISTGEARRYSEVATGFVVSPRVSGSNVSLDIYTQQEAYAQRGAIRGQQASSTVSGRLGDWIELGGVSSASTQSGAGAFSSRGGAGSSDRRIWVKVEEIR